MTKVELEKVSNADMHLFIKKGMRRGISDINKRYIKQIINIAQIMIKVNLKNDININNLYGGAMNEYLPSGRFKWVKVNRLLNKSDNSLQGYLLEADRGYPENLHDYYSMAPQKIKIEDRMLPSKIKKKYDIKTGDIDKLVPNLMSKNNYVVH